MRCPTLLPILAALAFVALGLPDGLLGVAWPAMRATFGLPLDALGPLLACYTGGYVASSLGGGWSLRRLGLGRLLVASCLATGGSLLGFAGSSSWVLVLGLAVTAGAGAGGIDAGINTYAATNHGPRLLNALHACYGIGATAGPALLTALMAAGGIWQRGYECVGLLQLGFAALFAVSLRAWPAARGQDRRGDRARAASVAETLRLPTARWGMLLFLIYTGLELAIGAWAFTLLTEGRGRSMAVAGSAASLYWAGLTAGRMLGAMFGARIAAAAVVSAAMTALTLALGAVAMAWSPAADLVGLIVAGLAAGPVFPTLIAATPARVGAAHAGNAVGFQIAASAIGQAMLPSLLGVLGRRVGLEALACGLVGLALLAAALHAITVRVGRVPSGADSR